MVRNFAKKSRASVKFLSYYGIAAASLLLAACGGGDGEESAAAGPGSGNNRAPTISGNPPSSALQGSQYSYTPSASDADGDALTFSVIGLPAWASFNDSNGRISGTPGNGDVGMYPNIRISVTDGQGTVSLNSFSIEVRGTATGAATLSWNPPTQKTDGSPLVDLAGYRVHWGTSRTNLANSVRIDNPGLSSYMIDQLTPATWYFATSAFDASGMESALSNIASKTIR